MALRSQVSEGSIFITDWSGWQFLWGDDVLPLAFHRWHKVDLWNTLITHKKSQYSVMYSYNCLFSLLLTYNTSGFLHSIFRNVQSANTLFACSLWPTVFSLRDFTPDGQTFLSKDNHRHMCTNYVKGDCCTIYTLTEMQFTLQWKNWTLALAKLKFLELLVEKHLDMILNVVLHVVNWLYSKDNKCVCWLNLVIKVGESPEKDS